MQLMALASTVHIAKQQRTISDEFPPTPTTIKTKLSDMHETATSPTQSQTYQLLMHQDVATLIKNTNSSERRILGQLSRVG